MKAKQHIESCGKEGSVKEMDIKSKIRVYRVKGDCGKGWVVTTLLMSLLSEIHPGFVKEVHKKHNWHKKSNIKNTFNDQK
jgi:hypothetical protein